MFGDMRMLGLYFLAQKLEVAEDADVEAWYQDIREKEREKLFPYLVEASEKIERGYVLWADPEEEDLAHLTAEELGEEARKKYPFNQPTGSQSAQLGPVLKRTYAKEKGAGPSAKILGTTMKAFEEIANSGEAWSGYFGEVVALLRRRRLRVGEKTVVVEGERTLLEEAVERIDEKKGTVFLAVKDQQRRLPGEVPEYKAYLSKALQQSKYATMEASSKKGCVCAMCGVLGEVYPNALKGAGLNFLNADRQGAFPSLLQSNAWKAFALCSGCADLLYVYKNHVASGFRAHLAGEAALVIPHLVGEVKNRKKWMRSLEQYLRQIQKGDVHRLEDNLLKFFEKEEAVGSVTIVWLEFGQLIEKPKGMLVDILPSRLGELSRKIAEVNESWKAPEVLVFPREIPESYQMDLHQNVLKELFNRPGGKSANAKSDSERLGVLRRELLGGLLYKRALEERRFWQEWLLTAQEYLRAWGQQQSPSIGYFLSEPPSAAVMAEKKAKKQSAKKRSQAEGAEEGSPLTEKKGGPAWMTLGGWVRHIARYVYFLRSEGVFEMKESAYEPRAEVLKPYLGVKSGIDSDEKAFAFLLGVLFGKLLSVQAGRGVNVAANALTWLKRLTLRGRDLPELYTNISAKLTDYGTDASEAVRGVLADVSALGVRLGSEIELEQTQTCYFLLLGKALSAQILPSAKQKEKDESES
ncbi:TM1802 family CRISPR-associated protein [Myxococcota bacterium]|nr:TM1802 family CRISPR-associated protein [Myxococcota bacterium]